MLNNFEPKTLVKPEHYQLIDDYFRYLELGLKHYAKENISQDVKKQKLELLEKALRKDYSKKNSLITKLQSRFLSHNLSLYLLLDPLYAWRYLAIGKLPTSEAQLSEFTNLLISPAARLIMALYDENPATYLPLSSFFSAMFLLDNFQNKTPLVAKIKLSKRQKISKLKGLLKNASIILSLVKSKRLKYKLALALNRLDINLKNTENNKQSKFAFLDNIRVFLYSYWQFISVKHKTLEKIKL
jgi:hypothetical protein